METKGLTGANLQPKPELVSTNAGKRLFSFQKRKKDWEE